MIRKAVIPAAGYGSRLFPATQVVSKPFFPVFGPGGALWPAVALIVAEALSAGVNEVVLVIRREQEAGFRRLFHDGPDGGLWRSLDADARRRADEIARLGERVRFAYQDEQAGLGHAVLCAREAVGGEPFLLLLGDRITRASPGAPTCARQLTDAYESYITPVIGLYPVAEDEVERRGVVSGSWLVDGRVLALTSVVEKPTPDQARRALRVDGLPPGKYLAAFGMYALPPEVFDRLARDVRAGVRSRGEVQLTPALDELCRRGAKGLLIAGESFDIGTPEGYAVALAALR